jgi:hypothetical protein
LLSNYVKSPRFAEFYQQPARFAGSSLNLRRTRGNKRSFKRRLNMRELTMSEVEFVSGGTGECSSESSGNDYGGITNSESVGGEIINIYEGLVEAASHIIERVANAL